jgi:hypothetical protein
MPENHTPLAFIDCETSHLEAEVGDAWEVAVIRRDPDGIETENLWHIRVDLDVADPESLRIGGYAERFAVPDGTDAVAIREYPDGSTMREHLTHQDVRDAIGELLAGAVLIGSNPGFDDRFLRKLLGSAPWHYRPVDIATLAAGSQLGTARALRSFGGELRDTDLPKLPFSSRGLSEWLGVEPPGPDVAHTALGDARWARDVWDAAWSGGQS